MSSRCFDLRPRVSCAPQAGGQGLRAARELLQPEVVRACSPPGSPSRLMSSREEGEEEEALKEKSSSL